MEFHHDNAEALCQACATRLADAMIDDLRQGRKPTMALAGGRTAPPIFRQLCTQDLPWAQLTVVPTDERWVPYAHPDCNLRQLRESFLAPGLHSVSLVPENPQGEVDAGFARRQLTHFAGEFSAVMLGMGADGHFASLFPGAATLSAALDPAAVEDAYALIPEPMPSAGPHPRISLSLSRLLRTRVLMLVITGADKARTLRLAQETPASSPVGALLHAPDAHVEIHWCP